MPEEIDIASPIFETDSTSNKMVENEMKNKERRDSDTTVMEKKDEKEEEEDTNDADTSVYLEGSNRKTGTTSQNTQSVGEGVIIQDTNGTQMGDADRSRREVRSMEYPRENLTVNNKKKGIRRRKFSLPFFGKISSKLSNKFFETEPEIRGEDGQIADNYFKKRERLLGKFFGDELNQEEIANMLRRSESTWFLEPEYDKLDISFDMDGNVNGGTWDALIEYLTPPGKIREDFNYAFMITFRVFADGKLLTEALIRRHNIVPPGSLDEVQLKIWVEKKQIPVKIKVFQTLIGWLEHFWVDEEDFECLPRIQSHLCEIVDESFVSTKQCQKYINKIDKMLERKFEENRYKEEQEQEMRRAQKFRKASLVSSSSNASREPGSENEQLQLYSSDFSDDSSTDAEDSDVAELLRVTIGIDLSFEAYKHLSHIAQVDPSDVASQLTILQSECYCRISPIELLRNEFGKKIGSKAINVKQMSTWSNQISRWVAVLVLHESSPEKRARVIKYFLELAKECLRIKNYDAVMAVQGALNSSAVLRLKRTWALLSKRSQDIARKLQAATDPSRNYARYRAVIRKSKPPLLPFLGLYLTDLTFICDGNPDMRRRKIVSEAYKPIEDSASPESTQASATPEPTNGVSPTTSYHDTIRLTTPVLPKLKSLSPMPSSKPAPKPKPKPVPLELKNVCASSPSTDDIDIRSKAILINFDKHFKVAKIIAEIQKYQIPYSGNFTMAIPGLQKYILRQISYWDKENYDDNKLYDLSLKVEPRAAF
ncbi:Cell division control protein 25 [Zancudomyces culisetae]|uniref:Cell division control protein 25 n=1 Tax=Zancudomyces culisetae TaxID=1213189 RepID=A0A1R1PMC8_ZANCU|nr:Cell division control protein 25 [Zancudomyces culisetae]OMH82032.1 Cell division control protein 25 [Zancudomyces culisetae]|eukprot:OMH78546.1 Cell division control protein 25 [Zancudomyces culisetae]